ncbi:hypothetical protein BDV26DRAFT_265271 [Aspergillus bertholletiae]|uniref:Uncharacterized protein n=1 Tax=Aspergillus bertholletiae TaxID=1226010 RepID=A0A5N7B3D8_9EURO|nr:hypothetical protein BDV26DRAFT_265271 [Aspergillus bertholletiae]
MPVPLYSDEDTSNTPATGTAGQTSRETLPSTNSGAGHVLGTGSSSTGHSSSALEERPLSQEEADRLYEERMEEEYAKREGGA